MLENERPLMGLHHLDVDAMNADLLSGRSKTKETLKLIPIVRLLLLPEEAALALRISPRLLWSKTKIGEIPCIRIGKAVRYSPVRLQRWIEDAES